MNNAQFQLAIKDTRLSRKTISIAHRVLVAQEDRAQVVGSEQITKQRLSSILQTVKRNFLKQLDRHNLYHIDVVVTGEMKAELEAVEEKQLGILQQ